MKMEVVGAIASLVPLVKTALSVAKTAKELYTSYREAVVASKNVKDQRLLIQSIIDEYATLRSRLEFDNSSSDPMPLDTRRMVATALLQVSETLQQLEVALPSREDRSKIRDRIRWVASVKGRVERAQVKLERTKTTLILALQFTF